MKLTSVFAAAALLAGAGCSTQDPSDHDCQGGKCDGLEGDDKPLDTPCEGVLFDRSGRGFLPERLADDPLVKHIYMDAAGGCPVTFKEIMDVIKKTDKDGCSGNAGMKTSVISEQAQLNDSADGAGYRTITSRTCSGREPFGLLFSQFGFSNDPGSASAGFDSAGKNFPGGIEIAAFDETNGVFNFYKEVNGKMGFFGSSTDFITKGPGGPGVTAVRGCANCHTGGGLIMKELENPWLHWEEVPSAGFSTFNRPSPGAADLISSRPLLGEHADGPRLEQEVIKPANKRWNRRRVAFINELGTTADLLEPLFCPVEVNIAATFNKRRVNHNFLVDQSLLRSLGMSDTSGITTDQADYDAFLKVSESTVAGSDQTDVRQGLAHVTRAFADIDYVDALIEAGIIDRGFADDVLMVDFTRPALSDERCDLLELAPDLATADRTPDKIRDGFLDNLSGAADGTPAGQLRAHLQARADGAPFDHAATVQKFLDACSDRNRDDQFVSTDSDFADLLGASELVIDSLKLRSLGRKISMLDGAVDSADGSAAHARDVFEFDDTLPEDGVQVTRAANLGDPLRVHPDARLSPLDCLLVDGFTPAGAATGGGDNVCPGQCGEFVNGASCQCDDRCDQFGNCCPGWEPVKNACPGAPFEFVNGASCQCDDRCTEFGNCCPGWEPLCLAN